MRTGYPFVKTMLLGTATAFAVVALGATAAILLPSRSAQATADYAAQTKLACGRCHVNPAGGGPRTAFGKKFEENGHKLPGK